jgi:hypothetical protein
MSFFTISRIWREEAMANGVCRSFLHIESAKECTVEMLTSPVWTSKALARVWTLIRISAAAVRENEKAMIDFPATPLRSNSTTLCANA